MVRSHHSPLTTPQPKITDFGLAKLLTDGPADGQTQTGAVVGTPGYMAPEQAAGNQRQVGPAVDVYALGAILYECLTGRPPFQAATTLETLLAVMHDDPVSISRFQPRVPRDLVTIAMRCLEKQPVKRYASARDVADDLARFLAGQPIRARRVGPLERGWRWCRRNPAVAGLLAGVAGLVALVFIVLVGGIAVSTSFGLEAQKRAGEAEKARDHAKTEEGKARAAEAQTKAAKRASDLQAARLKFKDAIGHAQEGDVDLGLYGMIEALTLAPDDADTAPFRRVVGTSFALWSQQLPTLRYVLDTNFDDKLFGWVFFTTVGNDGKHFVTFHAKQDDPSKPRREIMKVRAMGTGNPLGPDWEFARNELCGFTPDHALMLTRTNKDGKAFLQLRDTITRKPAGPARLFTSPDGMSTGPDDRSALPILVWSNGAVAAFGTAEGRRFWDLVVGQWYPLKIPETEIIKIFDLTLSNDQKPLAVVFHPAPQFSKDTPRLEFLDVTTGKAVPYPVQLAVGSDNRVSLDGRIFLTVDAGQCRWWDLATGRLIDRWNPRQVGAFSHPLPDAQTFRVLSPDNAVRLFALDTGLQRGGNLPGRTGDVTTAEPIVLARQGVIRAWNTQALALQATATANPGVRLFAGDAPTLEQTRERFNNGLLSPSGKLAFFNRTQKGQEYGRLVDVARGQPIGPALRWQRDRHLMVFSPDEKLLALASYNYMDKDASTEVHVYDTATGRLRLPPVRMPTYILSLAFTPDSRTLAVGCLAQTVLLDARSGRPRGVLPQSSAAHQLAVSPDGKALAIGYRAGWPGDGAGFRLWDLATAKPIGPFQRFGEGFEPQVADVSFMDQGRTVLTLNRGGDTRRPRVFDRETGQPSAAALTPVDIDPVSNTGAKWRVAARSTAERFRDAVFAFRSSAGTVAQWDAAAGKAVAEPMVHPAPVLLLKYSPDGRLLATACADNSVRLWDSATGLPLGPPLLHVAPVLSLCFAASGVAEKRGSDAYHLVTASAAGEIHDWPLPAAFPDDPERLTLWIEAAAGCKQGRTDTALLDAATWRERCRQLEERWPEAAAALAKQRGADLSAELAAWHEVRAREAEATGNAFAQLWHLDRLAEQRPDDWHLEARRGTALADIEDFDAALAAFALAAKKGAGEALADWYSHGAALASGAKRWQLARWYLDRQIAARPGDVQPYLDRADIHVRLRQWRDAADSYQQAARRSPLPLPAWHQLALVSLENDDLPAYRNICKMLVQTAGKTAPGPDDANAIAWICALGPKAVEDFGPVVALAEGTVKAGGNAKAHHDRLNTLGAVLCRASRYQDARKRLDECIGAGGKDAYASDWLFLALVHLGLDDPAQAEKCLAKVPQPTPRPGEVSWPDLETEVLRREIETRLKQRSERSR